jgi:hypothetical protein
MASRGRKKKDQRSGEGANRRGGRRAAAKSARDRDGGRNTSRNAGRESARGRNSGREQAARGAAGQESARGRSSGREPTGGASTGHIAIGYTDRADLDRFIGGERGDVVIHGPLHAGKDVEAAASLGPGVTEGAPCMIVPLIRERIDEIQREVTEALNRFQDRAARGGTRPRNIRETGGSVRGTTVGAIRLGGRVRRREIE